MVYVVKCEKSLFIIHLFYKRLVLSPYNFVCVCVWKRIGILPSDYSLFFHIYAFFAFFVYFSSLYINIYATVIENLSIFFPHMFIASS